MIKVVVDSTADIPDDLAQQFDIRIVPLNVHFGDETLRDGIDITKDEFYQRLVESNVTPKTSAPTIGSFVETYEQLAKETDTILSLHLGGKLSATVTAARQAAPEVSHVHIEIVDTNSIATPITYMAVAAVKAIREGKKLDEIVALVHNIAQRSFLYIGLDTLKYLERGGRIGRVRAFLGTLLNVKPLIEVRDGEVQPVEQVRTSKRLQERMLELTRGQMPLEELAVLYTADLALAQMMANRLAEAELLPRERIRVIQMGGVIGTHIGPGGVGITGVHRA
ncbi:MAG: DegV family protein [Chloroflexales bacterium]|nr:DegV family protein [Chloroflexales bacterium]